MASVDRQTTQFSTLQGTAGQALSYYPRGYAPGTGTGATGPGSVETVDGYNGALMVQIIELGVGTATAQIQGSFDGTNWYSAGYYQVDNTASLVRAVADIAVVQSSSHVYQVLDAYPLLRVNLSANLGSVYVSLYAVPN